MISFFRRWLSSPIVLVLFALVVVAFVIVGIGNPLGGGAPAGGTVAEVGDQEISAARLSDQFDRRLQAVRQQNPELTARAALDTGALDITLDQLVISVALEELARDMGLSTSKRLVDADIAGMEAFAGPTGQFSEQVYRDILQRQNIDERSFRQDLEGDVLRRHLLAPLAGLTPTPEGVARPFAELQLEQRTLSVGAIPYSRFDVDAPNQKQLAAFYKENQARFTIPERRKFQYAIMDRADLAQQVEVTDADIAQYYEDNSDLYAATETRSLRQVVTQDRAQADTIAKRVRAGEDFAAVAADVLDYSESDLDLGSTNESDLAGIINDDVAAEVFAASEGNVVGPAESNFGFHVISVDAVETTPTKPLSAVQDEIRNRLIEERAEARVAELTDQVQDAIDDGASLQEAASDAGLRVMSPPALTETGQTPEQEDFSLPADLRPLLGTAFDLMAGDDPLVEEIGEGRYALVGLDEVIPAAPRPLADIREEVSEIYIFEEQRKQAEAKAKEIIAAVRAGGSLSAEMEAAGVPAPQDITARRAELAQQEGRLPPYVALGFAQGEGDIADVPLPQQGVQVIVETTRVVPGDLSEVPGFLQTVSSQLRAAQATELQLAFANAVSKSIGTKRYPDAVTAVEAQYRGAGPDVE